MTVAGRTFTACRAGSWNPASRTQPMQKKSTMTQSIPARKLSFRLLAASAAALCCFAGSAPANPTGAIPVVPGTAAFLTSGNLLQITNSPNAIINWQSFSISAGEITRFVQQSSSSAVLNRVVTQNPSVILGALQSNGRVFLVNPGGILFGAGAQVDVAGLVATSLNLTDSDFLKGRLKFTDVKNAGSVVNQGTITTARGGGVYLVGAAVTNGGLITSPAGEVILAAGSSVELVNPGTPNLSVLVKADNHAAINLGQIVADSGRVGIYAGLITQSGTISADSAVVDQNGRIVLKATKSVTVESGSRTTANGTDDGLVEIKSAASGGSGTAGSSPEPEIRSGKIEIETESRYLPRVDGAVEVKGFGTDSSRHDDNLAGDGKVAPVPGSVLLASIVAPSFVGGMQALGSGAAASRSEANGRSESKNALVCSAGAPIR
jgi:filamentous hemagglutinin family protein